MKAAINLVSEVKLEANSEPMLIDYVSNLVS